MKDRLEFQKLEGRELVYFNHLFCVKPFFYMTYPDSYFFSTNGTFQTLRTNEEIAPWAHFTQGNTEKVRVGIRT